MGGKARISRTWVPILCLLYSLRRTVHWNKYHKARLPGTLLCHRQWAYLVVSSLPPESEQLLVLPRHKVDGGILEQGWEHEEQAHSHPNVNGFHVGHLEWEHREVRREYSEILSIVGCFLLLMNPPSPTAAPLSWDIREEGAEGKRRKIYQEDWTECWGKKNVVPRRVLKRGGQCG